MKKDADERFIELWNDYLEGDLDESGIKELRALVAGEERLERLAADSYQVHRMLGLIAQDSPSRQEDFISETMDRLPADEGHFVKGVMQRLSPDLARKATRPRIRFAQWPLRIAMAASLVMLLAILYFQEPTEERKIAKITGLSGSVQWTGDGGRVFHDLSVGTQLPGGTIEGLAPSSWLELEFNDGSSVAILGISMLTFSDHGQKELHLKEGKMSSDVRPQPAGKPMLIHTRSALLEVLGTQFEIEAGLTATVLNVSEGKVRVKRLSDGSTVDVPAKHRLIASADRDMLPVPAPSAAHHWKSQLHLGPKGAYGKWSPGSDAEEPGIRAIPYTTPQGKTIYTASFRVSRGDGPPVILRPNSRLRVRGRMASSHKVYFGVTLRNPKGDFAGRFQSIRPAVEFQNEQDFEIILNLRDFQLDPSLNKMKNELPSAPFDLVVESFWCHTLDKQAGLEIAEVELIPPAENESE